MDFEGQNDQPTFKDSRPLSEKEELALDSLLADSTDEKNQIDILRESLKLEPDFGEGVKDEILKEMLIDLYLNQVAEDSDSD